MLDRVFSEVVESGKPDFPFCLCWANHSWYQKTWDPTKPDKLLIEQTYLGEKDYEAHFYSMLSAFRDNRYMKVDGKLLFAVYDSTGFKDFAKFKKVWNTLAEKHGLKGFYFVGFTFAPDKVDDIIEIGYDAVTVDFIVDFKKKNTSFVERIKRKIFHRPQILHYSDYSRWILKHYKVCEKVHPCLCPNFDHSPRSRERGVVISDHAPRKWEQLCKKIFLKCVGRLGNRNLIFVKAWNEWGEGNYLEPDLTHGRKFIDCTRSALESVQPEE